MGIFDFLSNSNQTGQGTVQDTSSQVPQASKTSYNGIGSPPSGRSYNGIGSSPNGQSYNGIGSVQSPQSVSAAQIPVQPTNIQTNNNSNQNTDNQVAQTGGMSQKPMSQTMDKKTGMDIMTRLTQRSNRVLSVSAQKALSLHNQLVDSEHLLFGLLNDTEIFNLLSSLKLIPQEIQKQLETLFKQENNSNKPQISPRVKKILEDSLIVARKLGFEFISPEHILYALYNENEGAGARLLAKMGLNKEELNIKVLGNKRGTESTKEEKKKSGLEKYAIDLTAKAASGKLDPIVERSITIERLIHILSRRGKNNPVLTGEAGVGKTAVVEGLAEKIVAKEVPETMLNKKIYQLDLMSILAGASHRGEFEERLKGLLDELKANPGQVILFIDEIHNIVGAGGSEGSGDAANIIKPALARGEIQLIGATTTSEYRKYIEKDPALERRFQTIEVPEPTAEQAIKMLRVLRDKYEAFHKVKIPDEAIEAAVKLSKRYVGGRFLPDKAIDLIDEAASAVRLPIISLPEEMKSLEESIKALEQEKQEALKLNNKVKANILEKRAIDLSDALKNKQEDYAQKKAQSVGVVTEQLIKDIISRWTGIPVNKISQSEKDKIANLEEIMHKRLIGQKNAVSSVSQAIRRSRAGLKSAARPIGSFIFLGPTGVGKTELVKTLAEVLFGTEDSMVRFDMTEYMEKHEVAKLLGAPPGYVGYEEGGKLTEAVKRKPYSVVLFDEVEKAHPDIFNILLQMLDDGRLTDNKGHTISFKNTVIICTSNLGSRTIQQELMKSGKEQIEEPVSINTYAVSPRGREIVTMGSKLFTRETGVAKWEEHFLHDYFSGEKIVEKLADGSTHEIPFEIANIDTHTISPQGAEFITASDNLYMRTATTAKEWTKMKLLEFFKDNVVVNAMPDTPDEQLPTAKLATHSFNANEEEIVTFKNHLWKRKNGTKDWQIMGLADYLEGIKTDKGQSIPTAYWNIHLINSQNQEIIVVGESVYVKKNNIWDTSLDLRNFFGKNSPLEVAILKNQETNDESDTKKFAGLKAKVMEELMKFMRPELVNRFDEVIVFEPLKYIHMLQIVKLQIKSLAQLLAEQSYGLKVTDVAQKEIVRTGFDPVFGARPLRRAIQKMVENPISELIIAGKVKEGDTVLVDFDGEKIVFSSIQTELTDHKEEAVKETITCFSCSYRFQTEVLAEKSTIVCAHCGKAQIENKEKKVSDLKSEVSSNTLASKKNPKLVSL